MRLHRPGGVLIKTFVPFTRRNATQVRALRYIYHEAIEMIGDEAYPDHFAKRWREGIGFVNLEHDVIPWPGAIRELATCTENWCGFAYQSGQIYEGGWCYFGLVKFSAAFIAATPGIWSAESFAETGQPRIWTSCDAHLSTLAILRGLRIHQHFPPVIHDHA